MLRTLLVLGIIVAAIVFALVNPFGALLAYQWFAYFRPQEWVWTDISGFRFSMVLGLILVLRCLASGVLPNITHRFSIGMLLFLLTGIVAQVNAMRPDIGWQWIDHFARLALLSMLIVSLVNTPRRLLLAVAVIAVSLGVRTAKIGFASILQGGIRVAEGYGGSFVDNNGFALAAVMIMPMLWALSNVVPAEWKFRRQIVWALRLSTLFSAYAAVSTFSRGGLLALIAGSLAFILTLRRRRLVTIAAVALVGTVVAPFVTLPEGYTERMETITSYEEVGEDSALSRLHFWEVAVEMAKDHPLGIGMFNFQVAYDQYDFLGGRFGSGRAVHSSHFQVLAEQGFLGLFVWIMLFASALRACLRIRGIAERELADTQDGAVLSNMAQGLFVSMVAFLVGGSFINLALNEITWNTFALVAALERVTSSMVHARKEVDRSSVPARGLRHAFARVRS